MFEDIKIKIDKVINNAIDDISTETVKKLVSESPVWTGEFVRSHIAEESPRNYPRLESPTPPPFPPVIPDADGLRMAVKERLELELKTLFKKTGYASINNKAPHANFVEYLGWEMILPKGKKNVSIKLKTTRMPFFKTKESIKLRKRIILSLAKSKVFK